jgi:hypothetical protein
MVNHSASKPPAPANGRAARADGGRAAARDGRVSVQLTSAQVDQVLRASADARGPSLNLLLSGLVAEQSVSESSLEERYWTELESGRLSHSLFRGLLILALFISGEEGRGVVDVARQLGLSPSTTHRYITTLVAFGLLVQDPLTRKYRLPQ